MKDYPDFGKSPIRCGRTRCSWRGYETDLHKVPSTIGGLRCTRIACPTCGCDSYSFMTVGEIEAWERKQRAQAHKES